MLAPSWLKPRCKRCYGNGSNQAIYVWRERGQRYNAIAVSGCVCCVRGQQGCEDYNNKNDWDDLSSRIRPPPRILLYIPIDTGPIDQPQWIGLQIPPRCGIIVAHPVLVQAGFGLEPLAGEAGGDGRSGGGSDAAEGEVACGPGFGAACVGAEDGPADVIRPDEGGDAAFDDGEGSAVKPDIFADQCPGGLVVFGDPVALTVEDGVDGDPTAQAADRLPAGEIVFVAGFEVAESVAKSGCLLRRAGAWGRRSGAW